MVKARTVICSEHFEPECFQKKPWHSVVLLKPGSVPTKFQWTKESQGRRPLVRQHREPDVSADATVSADEADQNTSPAQSPTNLTQEDSGQPFGPQLPSPEEFLAMLCSQQREIDSLKQKLVVHSFGLERYGSDRKKIKFYTGFTDYAHLKVFIEWVSSAGRVMAYPYCQKVVTSTSSTSRRAMTLSDELFMTMCRLHAGLLEEDIADRFNISVATVSRIFLAWINLLYVVMGSFDLWLSKERVQRYMPEKMKLSFPDVRIIIDCTEIFVQKPSSLVANSQFFSAYKNYTTMKGLIGIAPHGPVTYVSNLYAGGISDVELTKICGILDLLEPGDGVMADKGFTIGRILEERGANLMIPHFLPTRGQFSSQQVCENDLLTSRRVHVERAIRRVKENRIFNGILPMSMLGSINQIWAVSCLFSNFRTRLM